MTYPSPDRTFALASSSALAASSALAPSFGFRYDARVTRSAPALCVLGCRSGSPALLRRVAVAARAFHLRETEVVVVVACGGRAWGGVVEADDLALRLRGLGVPLNAIVRERCSLDTRDNARFAAALLTRRSLSRVVLVSCAWHLARASMAFRAAGLDVVDTVGAESPDAGPLGRRLRDARERLSSWNDARRMKSPA